VIGPYTTYEFMRHLQRCKPVPSWQNRRHCALNRPRLSIARNRLLKSVPKSVYIPADDVFQLA